HPLPAARRAVGAAARRDRPQHPAHRRSLMTLMHDEPRVEVDAPVVQTMTMAAALNRALADAITEDPNVVIFGEDVGALGGVFRITDGLTERFGEERCFDTPLAESGIMGTAVGMAMNGMRPVVEMQFDAFAL